MIAKSLNCRVLSRETKRNEEIIKRSQVNGRSSTKFDHFFRFTEITDFLKGYASEHPNLMTVESAGKSYQGRDLWLVKISNTGFDGSKPVIFIDSNIHAREWIAVMSILNLIHELVDHAAEFPEMYAVDWMIIPMANPDGYEYSHTDDRMWRKTMSSVVGSTCLGTDPNRNFAHQWQLGTSTSDSPCSLLFRGPRAESEIEVQVISNLLRANASRIKLYLAIHSFGDYLLYPFGYDFNIPNPNEASLNSLGTRVANAIRAGYPSRVYTVGNSATALYPASGASDDFAAGVAGIVHSFTVELTGGGSTGFDLEPERIQQVSNEIFLGYREYAIWAGESA